MAYAIVYLHGVGQKVRSDEWYDALVESLESHGIDPPALTSPRMICPDYVDLLKLPPSRSVDEPTQTAKPTGDKAARLAQRAQFARDQAAAVAELPGLTTSQGLAGLGSQIGPEMAAHVASDLEDAASYLANKALRSAVLHRVLHDIGKQRDLIVVGHSLGSVVAIDLISHLPKNTHVRRLLTLGSPAGNLSTMRKRPELLLRTFPFHRVDGWVNALNPWDFVTRGLGLAALFPAAVDARLDMGHRPTHSASAYLRHPAVAKILADAIKPVVLSGSSGSALDVPMTRPEEDAVDTLLFSAMVAEALKPGEKQDRYREAIKTVQQGVSRELIESRERAGRPIPSALTDLSAGSLTGLTFASREMDAQLLFAVISATNNPIAPFEIDCPDEQRRAVRHLWTRAYTYSSSDAEVIVQAIEDAGKALKISGTSWTRYAIGAAGLALLAAGPIGLIVAAPAGLAGAAAITSALATFGPGGMVGGMALAGSLIGLGSSTMALSATLPSGMTTDMVRTQCIRVMAFARAQDQLAVPGSEFSGWHLLVAWESALATEREQLAPLSDSGSGSLSRVHTNLTVVRRAIAWMVDQGLAPSLSSSPEADAT